MKIVYSLILILLSSHSSGVLANDSTAEGGKLFIQNCGSCHGQSDTADNRIAPPIVAIKDHYLRQHADKKEFVSALVNWVTHPSNDRTLMPGAVRRFGLMPALPVSEQDLTAIAEFIYDEKIDKPDWYEKHYNAEHGTESNTPAKDNQ